ncbi:MAG: DNA polymerase domain-containing protein [Anaeromyxobacteraceae bacterium]
MTEVRGFIVSAWDEHRPDAPRRILATGRLEDGRSFALVLPAPAPAVYVAAADGPRAAALLADSHGATVDPTCWSDLAGAALARVHLPAGAADDAWRRLAAGGAPALHVERGRASDALLALGLAGPVALRGEPVPGRRVDLVFVNPELAPTAAAPTLAWLALDIETDRGGAVTAVSLAGAGGPGEVLFVGPAVDSPTVTSVPSERALLTLLGERLRARDPDVVTGWNVVDFDLQVLAARHAAHGIPFDVGRVPGGVALRSRTGVGRPVELTGRAVLDAMRLVRASGRRLDDLTLDGVAQAILGEGKTVSLRGEAKLRELERLQREEPARFCAYCLRDAELVLAILTRTGLDALTARRAALTGVSLDLAWTSIPSFERIYGAALRARQVVPPARTDAPVSGAAGGAVLAAEAGLFENVLVLDFRSLYPSLMRTFHLDPLAHARATARPRPDDLVAPNGARFDRAEGILPAILERYAREREAALHAGDETAAYVYKILQNSFYGVLGASSCRYARAELAGAITSFGQLFLRAARDWFEARGHEVLYGDTDSVFVRSGLGDEAGHAASPPWRRAGGGAEPAPGRAHPPGPRRRLPPRHAVREGLPALLYPAAPRRRQPGRARARQGLRGAAPPAGGRDQGGGARDGGGAERLHAAGPPLPGGVAAAPLRRRWRARAPRIRPGDRGPAPPGRARRRARVPEGAPASRGGVRDSDAAGPRGASPGLDGPPRAGGVRDDPCRPGAAGGAQRGAARLRALPRAAAPPHRPVDRPGPRHQR